MSVHLSAGGGTEENDLLGLSNLDYALNEQVQNRLIQYAA